MEAFRRDRNQQICSWIQAMNILMHEMLDSLPPHKISLRLSHLIPCCMQRLKLGQIEGYAK